MSELFPLLSRAMAQIFNPRANTIFRWALLLAPLSLVGIFVLVGAVNQSDLTTRAHLFLDQDVPFSHQHHVSGLGLDCRYCHVTVEKQRFATVPGPDTCMNCHNYMWKDAEMLMSVREAFEGGRPLKWRRVNDLPDYVYFHHGIHIQKGVSCVECHGQMENEALTAKAQEFNMQFCLSCHMNPGPHLRPKDEVFNLDWQTQKNKKTLADQLMHDNHVENATDCWRCHR